MIGPVFGTFIPASPSSPYTRQPPPSGGVSPAPGQHNAKRPAFRLNQTRAGLTSTRKGITVPNHKVTEETTPALLTHREDLMASIVTLQSELRAIDRELRYRESVGDRGPTRAVRLI
jgi:hypothetical protein